MYQLPEQLRDLLVKYLGKHPHEDVAGLIQILQSLKRIEPPKPPAEKK